MYFDRVSGIQGIVSGNTALATIEMDRRIQELHIWGAATDATDITDVISKVEILVNGVTVQEMNADVARLPADARQWNDGTTHPMCLKVHFRQPWFSDVNAQYLHSWDLARSNPTFSGNAISGYVASGLNTCEVKVSLKSGLVAPAIRINVMWDAGRNASVTGTSIQYRNLPIYFREYGVTSSGGWTDFDNLPKGVNYHAVFLLPESGTIEELEVKRDGMYIARGTVADQDAMYSTQDVVRPAGVSAMWMPVYTGQASDSALVNKELKLRFKATATGKVRIVALFHAVGFAAA